MDKVKMFIDNDSIKGLMAYDVVIERSDSGMLVAKLSAPVMVRIDSDDTTLLEFPKGFHAVVFDDTVMTMSIKGDYGISDDKDQMVFAKRNVIVENTETHETLETESLFWDKRKKRIYTSAFVTIKGPDRVIYGDSLDADENFSKRIIHGVRATIDVEEQEEQ